MLALAEGADARDNHYLDKAGIPHEHRENPGNHGGRANERYQVALQWLSHVLERD